MASPLSNGLFHKAIASSGSPICAWAFSANPKDLLYDVAYAANIRSKSPQYIMTQLRRLDIKELMNISKLVTLIVSYD